MQQSGWLSRKLPWVKKKKANPKNYTLYDSIYIAFLEWWNYRNGEQIGSCQELGMGREETGGRWAWL